MSSLFAARRSESPSTQPGLQDATSTTSASSSSLTSKESPLHRQLKSKSKSKRRQKELSSGGDPDPILCSRAEVGTGTGSGWSQEEQDQFISLVLPYIQGKSLSDEEIQLIRSEALEAHLPLECVDRLMQENATRQTTVVQTQENMSLSSSKHKSKDFESIEDVDESDNILAYFSRMSTLKQGGHFPTLNTEAISPFVEQPDSCDITEEVEVDLDVGYVNKSFNISMEQEDILQGGSWGDSEEDGLSQVSTAIPDHRNRYDSSAFESLLVGATGVSAATATSRALEQDEELDSIEQERRKHESQSTMQMEETSTEYETESDWAPQIVRTGKTYRYGYEHDLAEWRRKRDIALWQPASNGGSSSFFSCQAMAEAAVAEELNGLLWGVSNRPPRLRGMTAVANLVQQTEMRRKSREERSQLRHVPETVAAAPKQWQMPYRERCKDSPGYIGVDQYSLMDTAAPKHIFDSRDTKPWEARDVRQHFLNERSISLSLNWFGRLRRKSGNDPIKYRPCRPTTMGMPTAPSEASETDFDDCEWTDSPSKTTASKSWRTKDGGSRVNKTASLSFTSGEASDCRSEYDDSTRHTQSVHTGTKSATTRSHDGNSTSYYTDGYTSGHGSRTEVDFGSMMSSMMTGNETFTTFSNLRNRARDYAGPWMSEDEDDVESVGVSAILDADYEADRKQETVASGTVTVASATTDRYVSSFSETSSDSCTRSDDSRGSSGSSSGTSSSGSFCTEDSESTSSGTEGSWDSPECGTLVNVKAKLGERVSRVTPDHTSHLLRSRFRKKYLARGYFPNDK